MAPISAAWLTLAFAGSCLMLPQAAWAQPTSPRPTPTAQQSFVRRLVVSQNVADRVFDELQLTPYQREQCMNIVRRGYTDASEMRGQARESWHSLMELLRKPQASLQQALAKQRELEEYQESLAEKRLVTWFAVRQILTPSQLAKLSSLSLDQTLGLEDDHGDQSDTPATRNARH